MAEEDFERLLEARNFGGDVDRVWNLVDLLAQLLTMLHQDEVETWCNLQRDHEVQFEMACTSRLRRQHDTSPLFFSWVSSPALETPWRL
jgi:hypothetical protein